MDKDKTKNARNSMVNQNREGSYKADNNPRAPIRKRKFKSLEAVHHAKSCRGITSHQAGI